MAFVPYSLKKHKPAAFLKAIQLQNKNLSETWVIKIQGFSHEALDNCRQTLLSQPGVNTITPTPRNIEKGEWKILIARNHLPTYYQWLENKMDSIVNSIPADTKVPENYPPYGINSQPPTTYQDSDQDDISFGTMFSNAMTELTAQSPTEYAIPTNLFNKSYATTKNPTSHQTERTHLSDLSSSKDHLNTKQPYSKAATNTTPTGMNPYNSPNQNPFLHPQPPLEVQIPSVASTNHDIHDAINTLQQQHRIEIDLIRNENKKNEEKLTKELTEHRTIIENMQAHSTRIENLLQQLLLNQSTQNETNVSNKRQNTMSTPTKPRQESLTQPPDVDFDNQPSSNE